MECALTADSAASARQLSKVLQSLPEGEAFVQDDPALRRLIELAAPARPIRWSSPSSSEGAPGEASQATVTLAEALIAQTGSILVTASCGGRGASVIAPCHIVYATVAQLVPDLATALSRVSQERKLDSNSFACVISGSSRTADIEKILVQGAHGPRRLVVILQTETVTVRQLREKLSDCRAGFAAQAAPQPFSRADKSLKMICALAPEAIFLSGPDVRVRPVPA